MKIDCWRQSGKIRAGFSLIELLTVVAIVAVLAAILFPQFQRIKNAGNKAAAIKNAQTLVMGGIGFANDHDGNFPTTDWSSPEPSDHKRWVPELVPYVYSEVKSAPNGAPMVDGTFRCPSLAGHRKYGTSWEEWGWDSIDWMNVHEVRYEDGAAGRPNLRKGRLGSMPFVVSTDRNDGTAGLNQNIPLSFSRYVPKEVWVFDQGVIVGYCDGHVETIVKPTNSKVFKAAGY